MNFSSDLSFLIILCFLVDMFTFVEKTKKGKTERKKRF